jgi:hypothetical protein
MPRDHVQKSSVLRRRIGWGVGCFGAALGAGWVLVHSTSWAGPLFANALRSVVGTDNVARIEDFVYAIDDRITRIRRRGEKPKARWIVPAPKPKGAAAAPRDGESRPLWAPFEPQAVGPVHKKWSALGDGQWVAVDDPRHPNAPTAMYKTLVHPDANRSWGELYVVAIDLEQTDLHAAAGTQEPKAELPGPKSLARPGRIPLAHHAALLGAFNGGFMAEHGHYGMLVDGVTLIKPRETSCTVVGYDDGTVEIATWKSVAHASERMSWFRQTPACMYENGTMHVGLRFPETRLWGATLDGDTVIRRSAIGLDESRRMLFVGIGNNMTARALAEGMRHAGAVDVAQLDVNWSYPKFLVYENGKSGALEAHALMEGFEYTPGDYLTKSSLRDFFYLTRRDTPRTSHMPTQSTLRTTEPAASSSTVAEPGATSSTAAEPGASSSVRAEPAAASSALAKLPASNGDAATLAPNPTRARAPKPAANAAPTLEPTQRRDPKPAPDPMPAPTPSSMSANVAASSRAEPASSP